MEARPTIRLLEIRRGRRMSRRSCQTSPSGLDGSGGSAGLMFLVGGIFFGVFERLSEVGAIGIPTIVEGEALSVRGHVGFSSLKRTVARGILRFLGCELFSGKEKAEIFRLKKLHVIFLHL